MSLQKMDVEVLVAAYKILHLIKQHRLLRSLDVFIQLTDPHRSQHCTTLSALTAFIGKFKRRDVKR